MFVFPGGRRDNQDFENGWLNIIPKQIVQQTLLSTYDYFQHPDDLTEKPPILTRKRDSEVPNKIGLRITALREAFEEAGCLLVRKLDTNAFLSQDYLSIEQKEDMRARVHSDAGEFLHICRDLHCYPDVTMLTEWCNWLTPVNQSRRYDTVFYLACTPEPLSVSHDNQETVKGCWMSPDDAYRQHRQKKSLLAPPQVYDILRLLRFPSFEYLKYFGENRSSNFPIQRWLPFPVRCSDGILLLLPGDRLYPIQQIRDSGDSDDWMNDEAVCQLIKDWAGRCISEHTSGKGDINCFAAHVFGVDDDDFKLTDWIANMKLHSNTVSHQGHLMPHHDWLDSVDGK
jgi:nucleoside diphosphate-linked moiety X motif protein 19